MSPSSLSTVTVSGGDQTSTGTPQTAASGSNFGNPNASAVQPGTAPSSLLTGQGGVPLQNQPVTTVNLAPTTATTSTTTSISSPAKHTHPALFVVAGLLILVAIVLVWNTTRSAKNTTV